MQDILLFIHQHMALVILLAIVLVVLMMLEMTRLKQAGTRLTPARVVELINHQKAIVIDIRSPESFAAGHLTGAISLPAADLKHKIKKIESFKSRPVVVICATGSDSPAVAALLTGQGFQAHVLNGGIRAWRDAELPLVKG